MMITNNLSSIQYVNRANYLAKICENKQVLHLGATDSPFTKKASEAGQLLHMHLDRVAKKIVGMDLDQSMISFLSKNYGINNIEYGNIENLNDYPSENFDVIIAGEIFEHLSSPGKALDCIRTISMDSTRLVVTVPNAYAVKGFLRAWLKQELIHPDHVLHHSPHTLQCLLERHGFQCEKFFSYVNGGKGMLASLMNSFISNNAQLAEGIGVVCKLCT